MEKYIKPEVEFEEFEQVDVLTASKSNYAPPDSSNFTTPIIP